MDAVQHLVEIRAAIKKLRAIEDQYREPAMRQVQKEGGVVRLDNCTVTTTNGPRKWDQEKVKAFYGELWEQSLKPPALDIQLLKTACVVENISFEHVVKDCSTEGDARVVIRYNEPKEYNG